MTLNGGSTTMRNVPDVALTADNVWVIYENGNSDWFGGTSCAAPLWAGFIALGQPAGGRYRPCPGRLFNPALYTIASSAKYTNCFHDITTGNNEWSGSPSLFVATAGYDLCTGLGTPNGTNLINALVVVGQYRHPPFSAAAAVWHHAQRAQRRKPERHVEPLRAR